MHSFRLNNLNLKFERFTPSGCKDKGISRFEFVARLDSLEEHNIFDPNRTHNLQSVNFNSILRISVNLIYGSK